MNARRIAASTLDGYLKLLRVPLDAVIRRLPGGRTGSATAARMTVDRVDSSIRAAAASALDDERLREDARLRQAAATERQRAIDLRRQAEKTEAGAESRLDARRETAAEQRERASATASARREQATSKQQSRKRRAEEGERKRTQASNEQAATVAEKIDSESSRSRLGALDEQALALNQRERAMQQADEAQRVADAAARVKRERKQG